MVPKLRQHENFFDLCIPVLVRIPNGYGGFDTASSTVVFCHFRCSKKPGVPRVGISICIHNVTVASLLAA